jgi:hypothetical protein
MCSCSNRAELGDEKWDERFALTFSSSLTYVDNSKRTSQQAALHLPDIHATEPNSRMTEESLSASSILAVSSASTCHSSTGGTLVEGLRDEDPEPEALPVNRKLDAAAAQMTSAMALLEGSGGGSSGHVHASVEIVVRLKLFPPFTAVPGFLLSYTGGLVATALLQALIPTLLELLGRDYENWAEGRTRTGRSQPAEASLLPCHHPLSTQEPSEI